MTGWAGDVVIAVVGLIVGAFAGRMRLRRDAPPPPARETTAPPPEAQNARAEQLRQLRHDLRGALSPALLAADRLLSRNDEAVRQSAEIVIRALERATALIDAVREPLPPTPRNAQTDGNGAEERKSA
jgi:signal transduction histidine kinase